MSLSKYYRYGAERGQEGNTQLKRMERKRRTPVFQAKRHMKKGIRTNLLSELLIERVEDNVARFRVSFNKKPLVGKVFTGILPIHYEEVKHIPGSPLLERMEGLLASMQHIHRELNQLDVQLKAFNRQGDEWYKKTLVEGEEGEQEVQATDEYNGLMDQYGRYTHERDRIRKLLRTHGNRADAYGKQGKHYPKIRTKQIKLRVSHVIEYDEDHDAWTCLAEPVFYGPTKTIKRWYGADIEQVPKGVLAWLTNRGLRSILINDSNSNLDESKHLGL